MELNQHTLEQCFRNSLDASPEVRNQSLEILREFEKSDNFVVELTRLGTQQSFIYFKNYCKDYKNFNPSVQNFIREFIICNLENRLIQECVGLIFKDLNVFEIAKDLLVNDFKRATIFMLEFVKRHQFSQSNRKQVNQLIELFPELLKTGLPDLHRVCKIFCCAIKMEFAPILMRMDVFSMFINLFISTIQLRGDYWKEKKWAYQSLSSIFGRYGKKRNDKKYGEFSKQFQDEFLPLVSSFTQPQPPSVCSCLDLGCVFQRNWNDCCR